MNTSTDKLEAIEAIQKKLVGKRLSYEEIYTVMSELAKDNLGDVLTTFFAASFFKEGFNEDELYYMTKAMVETGEKLRFSGIVADKHSIGGIAGTRTTMIVVPIIAAAGFKIPKTSSRAITSPAGTADVMEVLAPVTFPPAQIQSMVKKVSGCIVWGGKLGIAPADDVIIDVEEELSLESIEKVIVSIMAKKVAAGTNHLILDLPVGPTLKLKNKAQAEKMASMFQTIAHRFNIKTIIDINNMSEPAGYGVGPVLEAIDVLKVLEQDPNRPLDLEKKALKLAGQLLQICYESEKSALDGPTVAHELLVTGKARDAFYKIIQAQGGNTTVTSRNLKTAQFSHTICSSKHGTIDGIDNFHLNSLAKVLGAPVDQKAGLYLHKKTHDKVHKADELLTIYSSSTNAIQEAIEAIKQFPIYEISS